MNELNLPIEDNIESPAPSRLGDHGIDASLISKGAQQIVETLCNAGYATYLVGGCVRDFLLGRTPKDFDIATEAQPHQIVELFERARLIGRRFLIVHVRVDGQVFEVSTFRRRSRHQVIGEEAGVQPRDAEETDETLVDLPITGSIDDYGTVDDDAKTRDFTANALYYDTQTNEILDYFDGVSDLGDRQLRSIGDSTAKLQEDPVRVLRAIRLAAKLDLELDTDLVHAIETSVESLDQISRGRLYVEMEKLFLCGSAVAGYELLSHYDMLELLFPVQATDDRLLRAALRSTDERIAIDKPVTVSFVLAAMMWQSFQTELQDSDHDGPPFEVEQLAAKQVINRLRRSIYIPRRASYFIEDVWILQGRLFRRHSRQIPRMLEHRRFRAAYDLFTLRGEVGQVDEAIATWWTDIQEVEGEEREKMIRDLSPRRRRRPQGRNRKPRRNRPRND